MKARREEQVI